MDPMYNAHGIGYLTPSMFSFSRMSDRNHLAELPGATPVTNAVNFSHVENVQPGLDAARSLMELADTAPVSSNPPTALDSENYPRQNEQALFTHCQRCGYPFGASIRQEFCGVKQACDRRLRQPGYRVPTGRTQDLSIRNATIAKHPELGPPKDR
jgi:hypothetical protein